MNIGERIKERRKEIGLSVEDVAKKLNKNRATIYRYESNEIENLPISILEPLSKILQTTPSYLMGWEDNELTISQNMDKTERLKKIILNQYNSIREFSTVVGIPSTTLTSALDKGIGGMAVDRIIKICDILNIDVRTFEPLENISKNTNDYSEEEKQHIEDLRKLNDTGKNKVINYTKDLIEMPKYQKESNITELTKNKLTYNDFTTIAAHNDNLTDEEISEVDRRILEDINRKR